MFGNSGAQLEIGIEAWPAPVDLMKRGGAGSIGQLVAFDISNSDAAVDNNAPGNRTSGLGNGRAPASGDLTYGQFAVLKKACADDARVPCVYRGFVEALVQKNSGNIAAGDPLVGSASGYLDADTTSGNKIIARAAEAVTGPSTATLAKVFFEGIFSLGTA